MILPSKLTTNPLLGVIWNLVIKIKFALHQQLFILNAFVLYFPKKRSNFLEKLFNIIRK